MSQKRLKNLGSKTFWEIFGNISWECQILIEFSEDLKEAFKNGRNNNNI